MKTLTLRKDDLKCACGCKKPLIKGNLVNKMNDKYYRRYCGKMYRLHVESAKWIKSIVNEVRMINELS